MKHMETRNPPASATTVDQLLPLFQGKIPQEYRDFLAAQDGCEIRMERPQKKWDWRLRFLSVAEVLQAYRAVEEMYYEHGAPRPPGSFAQVPIATDDGSNYLVYDLRRPVGETFPICLVDHGDYEGTAATIDRYKRAEHLLDLLDQLQRGVFQTF